MDPNQSTSTKTPTERITEMSDEAKFSDKVLQNIHHNYRLN